MIHLYVDGAPAQLAALAELMEKLEACKMMVMRGCPGATQATQACDVAKMFNTGKTSWKNAVVKMNARTRQWKQAWRDGEGTAGTRFIWKDAWASSLTRSKEDQGQRRGCLGADQLSSAKRNLVLHLFVELPGILRVCMAPQIIVSGWENTFLSPFDGVKILTHSTSWGVVSQDFRNHQRSSQDSAGAPARQRPVGG